VIAAERSVAAPPERVFEFARVADRLLLALGGNAWFRRLFRRALANLETAL
jgi:uncharacterized protein YndB with AHSA1/START domain